MASTIQVRVDDDLKAKSDALFKDLGTDTTTANPYEALTKIRIKRRNSFMIDWSYQEEGVCEGSFKSKFFRDDENSDVLNVGVQSPDLIECAEKCVEAFNNFTESEINEICKEIINCAKEGSINEEFELPTLENALDILNYCWFTTLYVNMLSQEDEISYVVEGEGDWGDVIGFVVNNNKVIYVGTDYFDYMKDGE